MGSRRGQKEGGKGCADDRDQGDCEGGWLEGADSLVRSNEAGIDQFHVTTDGICYPATGDTHSFFEVICYEGDNEKSAK